MLHQLNHLQCSLTHIPQLLTSPDTGTSWHQEDACELFLNVLYAVSSQCSKSYQQLESLTEVGVGFPGFSAQSRAPCSPFPGR